jgi:hypothetical protein
MDVLDGFGVNLVLGTKVDDEVYRALGLKLRIVFLDGRTVRKAEPLRLPIEIESVSHELEYTVRPFEHTERARDVFSRQVCVVQCAPRRFARCKPLPVRYRLGLDNRTGHCAHSCNRQGVGGMLCVKAQDLTHSGMRLKRPTALCS